MNKTKVIEYLTGFFIGAFIGLFLDASILVYNQLSSWLTLSQVRLTWWNMLPMPILLGLGMAKFIADRYLRD